MDYPIFLQTDLVAYLSVFVQAVYFAWNAPLTPLFMNCYSYFKDFLNYNLLNKAILDSHRQVDVISPFIKSRTQDLYFFNGFSLFYTELQEIIY